VEARGRGGALVTGAGRGLGKAIAQAIARKGLTVHATDIDGDAAMATAAEIGGDAWASKLDVTDAPACAEAARATAERAGSLAVWVNNAGVLATGLAWEHSAEERRRLFAINVDGTINGTVAALELMRPANSGHVINVVSLAGLVAAPGETLYSATKHAAMAYTVGTLLDLRRSGVKGVDVSAVCPDGVWTPMLEPHVDDPDAWPSWSGVMLKPEQVGEAVAKLLDKPRPVLTLPRWRGGFVRLLAATPGLMVRMLPRIVADSRRKQRAFGKRLKSAPDERTTT
jgi:NAD(P)-dependent dehydrogenase (short-subunit alcohol dehydrogenase family)